MTTVVPTSEEDPSLAIVRFTSQLAWADAGPEVAELQVTRLCREAEESIVAGRWLDLATLMVTSDDLVSSKISEKESLMVEEARSLMVSKEEESELLHLTLMKSMNMRMSVSWKDYKTESFS